MSRKARKEFIEIARLHDAKVVAILFECNKDTLVARNAKRVAEGGRDVPEHVIDSSWFGKETHSL